MDNVRIVSTGCLKDSRVYRSDYRSIWLDFDCFNDAIVIALIAVSYGIDISRNMDDIRFQIDLVYIPIWEVKGARNSVEINAYTQEILTNPVDDDVEFM